MPSYPYALESRLPKVGTTIFTVMSGLAQACGAINLSQGFPDFNAEPELFERVHHWMRAGHNQYAPMPGVMALREAVVAKVAALYGKAYDPEREVTITAGATQALLTTITAFVRPGDEVIIFEPAYDAYAPAIELNGERVVRMRLSAPHYRPDWAAVRAAVTPRTRLVIINSPHNPTATVSTTADLDALAVVLRDTPAVVLSDEVYEHIVFDGQRHASCAAHPELAQRSVVVSSFGKTYHITGWKVGYVVGPAELMAEFRKVHQFNVFTVNTPVQYALADYMQRPERHLELAAFYQRKRDLFRAAMAESAFELLPSAGTYFQLARYAGVRNCGDQEFVTWLTREIGVAAIPLSAFFDDGTDERVVRFCFAKNDDTLLAACERLRAIPRR